MFNTDRLGAVERIVVQIKKVNYVNNGYQSDDLNTLDILEQACQHTAQQSLLLRSSKRFHVTVEVRPDDYIDLNGAFHTWSLSDVRSYDTNFGRITLRWGAQPLD